LLINGHGQLLNILFALSGITGALYGIGQRSHDLVLRGTMETAMFVSGSQCAIEATK
jgi:hypothetical protein